MRLCQCVLPSQSLACSSPKSLPPLPTISSPVCLFPFLCSSACLFPAICSPAYPSLYFSTACPRCGRVCVFFYLILLLVFYCSHPMPFFCFSACPLTDLGSFTRLFTALCAPVWPFPALCTLTCPFAAICSLICPFTALFFFTLFFLPCPLSPAFFSTWPIPSVFFHLFFVCYLIFFALDVLGLTAHSKLLSVKSVCSFLGTTSTIMTYTHLTLTPLLGPRLLRLGWVLHHDPDAK